MEEDYTYDYCTEEFVKRWTLADGTRGETIIPLWWMIDVADEHLRRALCPNWGIIMNKE